MSLLQYDKPLLLYVEAFFERQSPTTQLWTILDDINVKVVIQYCRFTTPAMIYLLVSEYCQAFILR